MPTLLPLLLALAHADDVVTRHQDLAAASTRAELDHDYAAALKACTEALTLLPEGPRSERCRARVTHLALRQDADGSWQGWRELETIRAAYGRVDDSARRAQVIALLSQEGVADATRAEAALWLAADSLERRQDATEALAATTPVYADRSRLEPAQRTRAVMLHAAALAKLGRVDEALQVEDEVRVASAAPRLTPVEREARRQQQQAMVGVAWGAVALFAGVAAPRAARSRPLRVPAGLGLVLGLGVLTALLVNLRDDSAGAALPAMGLGFGLIHLVAAPARAGAPAPVRALLTVLGVAATLAVAYLALHATNTLGWVGL